MSGDQYEGIEVAIATKDEKYQGIIIKATPDEVALCVGNRIIFIPAAQIASLRVTNSKKNTEIVLQYKPQLQNLPKNDSPKKNDLSEPQKNFEIRNAITLEEIESLAQKPPPKVASAEAASQLERLNENHNQILNRLFSSSSAPSEPQLSYLKPQTPVVTAPKKERLPEQDNNNNAQHNIQENRPFSRKRGSSNPKPSQGPAEKISEDFDFVGNNARFDKKKEYAIIRGGQEDRRELFDEDDTITSAHFCVSGVQTKVTYMSAVTRKEQREIFEAAETAGFPARQFWESAGRALAEQALLILKKSPRTKSSSSSPIKPSENTTTTTDETDVVILVGPGGTGLCGMEAARHLSNHKIVTRIARSRAFDLDDHWIEAHQRLLSTSSCKETHVGALPVAPVPLIIDALLGIGYDDQAQIDPAMATLIRWANGNTAPILSMDVPTGLNCNTGKSPQACINAQYVLSVVAPKPALYKSSASISLADIGLPLKIIQEVLSEYQTPFSTSEFILQASPNSRTH